MAILGQLHTQRGTPSGSLDNMRHNGIITIATMNAMGYTASSLLLLLLLLLPMPLLQTMLMIMLLLMIAITTNNNEWALAW
jgi:hypothetical protein